MMVENPGDGNNVIVGGAGQDIIVGDGDNYKQWRKAA